MSTIWILVAESSKATIYAAKKPASSLSKVQSFSHPESRLHEQELTSDLPGRTFDSLGSNRHAMSTAVEPKKEEAIRFSKELVEALELGRAQCRFDKLYIVAPPEFLGLLRAHASALLADTVVQEINKNLTALKPAELRKQLPEYL